MGGNAQRVLVIEDDPDTAQQLVDCLRTSGYTVDLASDGDKGLALGRTADYVVMTVDRMFARRRRRLPRQAVRLCGTSGPGRRAGPPQRDGCERDYIAGRRPRDGSS